MWDALRRRINRQPNQNLRRAPSRATVVPRQRIGLNFPSARNRLICLREWPDLLALGSGDKYHALGGVFDLPQSIAIATPYEAKAQSPEASPGRL